MKRTTKFTAAALLAAALLFTGCHSASAQCAGGACSRTAGFWSPWGGVWYYSAPCAGGKCGVKKPEAEPADPEPADQKPELIEAPADPADPAPAEPTVCELVARIVNRHRAALGLPALAVDPALCAGAARHSAFMRNGGGFQHAYYSGGRECIAQGVVTPEAVVSLWLHSDGHRAILLGAGTKIGVGCAGTYWTLRVR